MWLCGLRQMFAFNRLAPDDLHMQVGRQTWYRFALLEFKDAVLNANEVPAAKPHWPSHCRSQGPVTSLYLHQRSLRSQTVKYILNVIVKLLNIWFSSLCGCPAIALFTAHTMTAVCFIPQYSRQAWMSNKEQFHGFADLFFFRQINFLTSHYSK